MESSFPVSNNTHLEALMKTKNKQVTLYISQYGDRFYSYTLKELRAKIRGRCERMMVDGADGHVYHVGYVIGQLWLTAYAPIRNAVPMYKS